MEYWIATFKVPLGVLATLIPIIAVLANQHRSIQNAEAMKIALSNNRISNHYKNIEAFEDYIQKGISKYEGHILFRVDPRPLYNKLYPNSRDGDIDSPDKDIVSCLLSQSKIIVSLMLHWNVDNKSEILEVSLGKMFASLIPILTKLDGAINYHNHNNSFFNRLDKYGEVYKAHKKDLDEKVLSAALGELAGHFMFYEYLLVFDGKAYSCERSAFRFYHAFVWSVKGLVDNNQLNMVMEQGKKVSSVVSMYYSTLEGHPQHQDNVNNSV